MAVQIPYSDFATPLAAPQAPGGGASFGQAEAANQELGAATAQVGQTISRQADFIQNIRNENNARDASVALNAQLGKIVGDYSQLQGKAADDGYDAFTQQLQAARKDAVAAMPNMAAGEMLGEQAAFQVGRLQQEGARHRGEAMTQWTRQSYLGRTADAANQAAQDPTNTGLVNGMGEVAKDAAKSVFAIDGGDASTPAGAATLANQTATYATSVYKPAILAAAKSNPVAAQAIFDAHKGEMTAAGIDEVTGALKEQGDQMATASGIAAAFTPQQGSAPVTGTAGQIASALHGTEASGANSTSVDGAKGEWQVTPGFFKQYAQPGESFDSEADRAAVAQRGIGALTQQYNGDPSRVAVAYFSGPSNVAPAGSPTPWINDAKDGNGTPTSKYVSNFLGRMGAGAAPAAPGDIPASGARGQAIAPRYFDEVATIQRVYQQTEPMMATNPKVALAIRNGVMEQISRMNAFENGAEDRASRDLASHQRDNEAVLFGATVGGQPIAESDLANYLKTQQITPAGYTAIKSVQQHQAEGQDDPMTVARVWDGIGSGKVTSEDVFNGITGGMIKGTTGNEMIKTLTARGKTQTDAVERGDYDTLKTALGGKALESGGMDIFGEGKQAQAQLWTQAQGEWNKRVISGKEQPDAVLADMMPRYQKTIPDRPAAWPNPRFGMVQSTQDVAAVAAKTKAALDAGTINQDTYQSEGALLSRYLSYFQIADAQKAAAAKVPTGTRRAAPMSPGSE